ncbi:MAG: phage protein Gp27 family protein [Candidatus Binataceae bacterium]
MLPKRLRDQLDEKLIKGAFSDYSGLAEWLIGQGFMISRSALHRYGSEFERKVRAIALATDQAAAIAHAAPDREDAMASALTRLVQERMFGLLVETEVSERDLPRLTRAIADLARASIAQKRWGEEITERLEAQKAAAQGRVSEIARRRGLSPEAAEEIRRALLDIRVEPMGSKSWNSATRAEDGAAKV